MQINAQVVKPDERFILSRLVQVMIAHKLRFFQERGEDGKLSYRLDPCIPPSPFARISSHCAGRADPSPPASQPAWMPLQADRRLCPL